MNSNRENLVDLLLAAIKNVVMERETAYIVFDKAQEIYKENYRLLGMDISGVITMIEREEEEDELSYLTIDYLLENDFKIQKFPL